MTKKGIRAIRIISILCVLGALSAIIAVVVLDPTENTLLPCMYYHVLGIRCATCGATRAVYSFFTGHIADAFHYHAYFTLLSPVIGYACFALAADGIAGKMIIPLPKKRWWIYPAVFAAGLIAFTVIRNFIPEDILF